MKVQDVKYKTDKDCNSDDVRFLVDGEERGFGFVPKKGIKTIALVRCPICLKENYAFNVLTGQCTWCGFNTADPKYKKDGIRKK